MHIATIAGVKLRFNLFFLLLCFLYIYLGMLEEIVIIFTALFIHELAHTIVAMIMGIKVAEVELLPFGGQAKIEDFTGLEPGKEILLAVAGPIMSLSLALTSYFLNSSVNNINLELFMMINLYLGLFNLIPALPLDGGRVLRAILSKIYGYKKSTRGIAIMGKIFALVIASYGAYTSYFHLNGANFLIIGGLLFWAANREEKFLAYAFMRYLLNKKKELAEKGFLPSRQIVTYPDSKIKVILDTTKPSYYTLVIIVNLRHEVLNIVSEAQLIECLFEKGPQAKLKDLNI